MTDGPFTAEALLAARAESLIPRQPAADAAAFDPRRGGAPPCGHPDGCTSSATHHTTRPATPEEAEAHWTAVEQNVRASNSGRPEAEYVADRTDIVTIAEHRCDDPEHADATYLEAQARERVSDA